MKIDNIIALVRPEEFQDQLTELLREGAQALVLQAVKAEFSAFLESHSQEKLPDGRRRVVRHGHWPERKVVTGIGDIPVKVPRARDRKKSATEEETSRFASQFLLPYVRRSKCIEMALPYLYLKDLSLGDFSQVMPVLLGKDAVGFSGDTVLRLRKAWKEELLNGISVDWKVKTTSTCGLTTSIFKPAWSMISNACLSLSEQRLRARKSSLGLLMGLPGKCTKLGRIPP